MNESPVMETTVQAKGSANEHEYTYFIKDYRNIEPLDDGRNLDSAHRVAEEFIAYEMFRPLCRVPEVFIGFKEIDSEIIYFLISRKEENYSDLGDFLPETHVDNFEKKSVTIERWDEDFERMMAVRSKLESVIGKSGCLVGAAYTKDHDALGASLRNVGVIPLDSDKTKWEMIKIDPGNARILPAMSSANVTKTPRKRAINRKPAVENYEIEIRDKCPEVLTTFSYMLMAPNIKSILGSEDIEKKLPGIPEADRLKSIYLLCNYSDEFLENVINQPCLSEILTEQERLESIKTLKARRDTFKEVYRQELADFADTAVEFRETPRCRPLIDLDNFAIAEAFKDEENLYGVSAPKQYVFIGDAKLLETQPFPIMLPRPKLPVSSSARRIVSPQRQASSAKLTENLPQYIVTAQQLIDSEDIFLELIYPLIEALRDVKLDLKPEQRITLSNLVELLNSLAQENIFKKALYQTVDTESAANTTGKINIQNFPIFIENLYKITCEKAEGKQTELERLQLIPLKNIAQKGPYFQMAFKEMKEALEKSYKKLSKNHKLIILIEKDLTKSLLNLINNALNSCYMRPGRYRLLFQDLSKYYSRQVGLHGKKLLDEGLVKKLSAMESSLGVSVAQIERKLSPVNEGYLTDSVKRQRILTPLDSKPYLFSPGEDNEIGTAISITELTSDFSFNKDEFVGVAKKLTYEDEDEELELPSDQASQSSQNSNVIDDSFELEAEEKLFPIIKTFLKITLTQVEAVQACLNSFTADEFKQSVNTDLARLMLEADAPLYEVLEVCLGALKPEELKEFLNTKLAKALLAISFNRASIVLDWLNSLTADETKQDVDSLTALLNKYGHLIDPAVKDKAGKTALHLAIEQQFIGIAIELINYYGIRINIANNEGRKPLHLAVATQQRRIVAHLLVKFGDADLKAADIERNNAFHLAVLTKNIHILKQLAKHALEAKLNVKTFFSETNIYQYNVFHLAALTKEYNLFNLLIKIAQQIELDLNKVLTARDQEGNTPLQLAIMAEALDIVGLMLIGMTDVDNANNEGNTALHLANKKNLVSQVGVMLVNRGANINCVNNKGEKALDDSAKIFRIGSSAPTAPVRQLSAHSHILKLFKQNEARKLKLHGYIEDLDPAIGIYEIGLNLKQFTFDVNAKDDKGRTALHLAAQKGKVNVFQYLLGESGIKVNAQDDDGCTPLHLALLERQYDIAKILIKSTQHKVDFTIGDFKAGDPALFYAIPVVIPSGIYDHTFSEQYESDNKKWVEIFQIIYNKISLQEKLNAVNKKGQTILHMVVLNNCIELFRYLASQTAQSQTPLLFELVRNEVDGNTKSIPFIDVQDKDGFTAAHYAAIHGHKQLLDELIGKGANLTITDNNQAFVLHYLVQAVRSFNLAEVLSYLNRFRQYCVDNKLSMNCLVQADSQGDTLLHYLAKYRLYAIIKPIDKRQTPPKLFEELLVEQLRSLIQLPQFIKMLIRFNDEGKTFISYLLEKQIQLSRELVLPVLMVADEKGRTMIHNAIDHDNTGLATQLLLYAFESESAKDNKNTFLAKTDKEGRNILHYVIKRKNLAVFLIMAHQEAISDTWQKLLHQADNENNTALAYSLIYKQQQIFTNLMAHGIRAEFRNNKHQTYLHLFADTNFDELTEEFFENLIFDLDASVKNYINARDESGSTALHYACRRANRELVLKLVNKKLAEVAILDNNDATPLHYAAQTNDTSIVEALLQKDDSLPLKQDHLGNTALHYVFQFNLMEMAKYLLILNNIDRFINIVNNEGRTALHTAIHTAFASRDYALINLLIAAKPDLDIYDDNGKTPLHYAVEACDDELVKILLEAGANVTIPLKMKADVPQKTTELPLLNFAVKNFAKRDIKEDKSKQYKIINMLLDKKMPLDIPDSEGRYALQDAIDINDRHLVKMLVDAGVDLTKEVTERTAKDKSSQITLSELLERKMAGILTKHSLAV